MADDSSQNDRQWSGKTGGGNFGQRFLFAFLKKVKVKWLYPVLYPVVPFYCLVNHEAFGNILWYFRNIHGFSRWKSFWMAIHNHFVFGKAVLDRFAILSGNGSQFRVEVENREVFEQLLEQPGGFIVAGSHVGNLELIGHFFNQNSKPLNVVIFGGEGKDLSAKRSQSFSKHNINDIPVSDNLDHIFQIKTALDRGEVVVLICDRIFGSSKTLEVEFFGRPAKLPLGSFLLAAQMQVPVVQLSAAKKRHALYLGYVNILPQPDDSMNLRTRAKFIAEQYAHTLEEVLRKHPEQWFNFFDFWGWRDNTTK